MIPLGTLQQQTLVLAPYGGTNLMPQSANIASVWSTTGTPIVTFDQVGILGLPNTASYVGDNSSGYEYKVDWYFCGSNALTYCVRVFIKKQTVGDGNNPDYTNVGIGFETAHSTNWTPNNAVAWQFNSITGAYFERYNGCTGTILTRTYAGNADWWEIIMDGVNQNDANDWVGTLAAGAFSKQWDTGSDGIAQGWNIYGNVELYEDTVKEDVYGGPVYTP